MKKLAFTVVAGLMALASTVASSAEAGKTIEDAVVHKHHWDVPKGFNQICTVKMGNTVQVINQITWLNGEELIHIKHDGCVGWTWQKHIKTN